MADLYLTVTNVINREPWTVNMPEFPVRFHTVEVEDGVPLIVEEGTDGVCKFSCLENVAHHILRYVTRQLSGETEAYAWTAQQAIACSKFWHMMTTPKKMPDAILWDDESGRCFHRMPWSRQGRDELPPTWAEIMSRLSNSKAICQWIGSIFDPLSDLQQYVWIYGTGQNGKGCILRFFDKALCGSYSSQQPPARDDKFWTSGLKGRRLVAFPDCNNVTFVTTGLFKSLTGGDAQRIEEKGKQPYTCHLPCKFLYMSNARPALSSEMADVRRAIYGEIKPITVPPDARYEERLWAEGGDFLRYCIRQYAEACGHGPVRDIDSAELDQWISTVEESFEVIFDRYLQVARPGVNQAERETPFCTPDEINSIIDQEIGRDKKRESEFRAWLERTHGVKKKRVKLQDGSLVNRYVGVFLK